MQDYIADVFAFIACVSVIFIYVCAQNHRVEDGIATMAQTECETFGCKIATSGELQAGEYDNFVSYLSLCGYSDEVCVTAKYTERDAQGKVHLYEVAWDEIRTKLLEEGEYTFPEGCAVSIFCMKRFDGSNGILVKRQTVTANVTVEGGV